MRLAALIVVVGIIGGLRDWLWEFEVGGARPIPTPPPVVARVVQPQQPVAAPAVPVVQSGGRYQKQRGASDCVATAFANAANVSLDSIYAGLDARFGGDYGGRYPAELGVSEDMAIAVLADMGYHVIRAEATPEVLQTAPKFSVLINNVPVWHAWNVVDYNAGQLRLWNVGRGWGYDYLTIDASSLAFEKFVSLPTDTAERWELHYRTLYIVQSH